MANNKIPEVLKKLGLNDNGMYDNHFYVIKLNDSDEYSKVYTLLNENAINTEYPTFGVNSTNNVTEIVNYFEIDVDDITYNIFLKADFAQDNYVLKIKEINNDSKL